MPLNSQLSDNENASLGHYTGTIRVGSYRICRNTHIRPEFPTLRENLDDAIPIGLLDSNCRNIVASGNDNELDIDNGTAYLGNSPSPYKS